VRTVSGGYFILPRGLRDHPVLGNMRRWAAFVWLVEAARWQDGAVHAYGRHIEVKRGQVFHSTRFMADAWEWEQKAVVRFLHSLNGASLISCDTASGQNLITISNYDEIQSNARNDASHLPQAMPQDCLSFASNKNQGNQGNQKKEVQEASPLACASPPPEVDQPLFEAPKKSHQGDLLHTADVVHLSARDVDKVLAKWNVMVKGLPAGAHIPAVRGAAGARERAVRKALREVGGLEGIDVLFGKVAASKFLNGQGGNFSATFDWVFAGGQRGGPNYQKIMEGNYDREFTQARKRGPDLSYMKRRFGVGLEPGPQPDAWHGTTIDMPLDGETEIV